MYHVYNLIDRSFIATIDSTKFIAGYLGLKGFLYNVKNLGVEEATRRRVEKIQRKSDSPEELRC